LLDTVNTVRLQGRIAKKTDLATTPQGLEVVTFGLTHEYQGKPGLLQMTFDVHVRAVGQLAKELHKVSEGTELICQGKLEKLHRNTQQLMIGLQQYTII
jgi:primosomal replication protein N